MGQGRVRFLVDQREGVVAAPLGGEIGLIGARIEILKEQHEIVGAALDVLIQALELRAADDGVDLRAADVAGRVRRR